MKRIATLAVALLCVCFGARAGNVPYPANVNAMPGGGLTSNDFLLGDTLQGLKDSGFATIPCNKGGTGLTSGTSGGILYFSGSCTLLSTVALTSHALVLGGGAGAAPYTLGSLGTTSQVLIGNVSGDPTWGSLPSGSFGPLTGDVTSSGYATTLAKISGVTASRVVAVDGSQVPTGSFASSVLAASLTDETGSGAAVFATSPTFVTPALGTPASGVLTNATGLPISTGVSGLGTGVATFLAVPSSANLSSALTDETGSGGAAVFASGPTLTGTTNVAALTASGVVKATGANLTIDDAAGVNRALVSRTAGSLRWQIKFADSGAESGSNAGSDLRFNNYDDSGVAIGTPLTIKRSSGLVTLANGLTVSGGTTTISGAGGTCTNQFARAISTTIGVTCASVSLTADVSGILPGANGGTGNGFFAVSGPATSLKTFAFPNASANVLTDNAVVTVAQGGIGVGTLASNGVLYGNGTGAVQALAVNSGPKLFLTDATSGAPGWNAIVNSDLPLATTATKGAIIPAICPTHYFSVGIDPGTATPSCLQPAFSDVTGSITSAQCPAGSVLAIGCLFAPANPPVTHQFLTTYNGSAWVAAQPDFSDLTGSLSSAQFGPLTGDVTTSGYAATVAKIQGTTVSGTTGSGNVAFSLSPIFTGTAQFSSASVSSALVAGSVTSSGAIVSSFGTSPQVYINPNTAVDRQFAIKTNGSMRWAWGADATAEIGSNAGSNGYLARYDDSNTLIDKPLTIVRSTGAITIADGLTVTGAFGTCTNQFYRAISTSLARTCATVSLTADVSGLLPNANLANSAVTVNGKSVSLGGSITLGLASADFANQGTATTVLHGNASGNPSFGAVSLSADVTGLLPNANLANSSVTISGHALSLGGSLSLASGDISGLGTAATQNTGTSGANLPFLNGANTFSGADHFSSSLYADADVYVTGVVTPPTIVANSNDYAPTGFATATVLRVSANSGPYTITGIAGGAAGRSIVIQAVGSNAFYLAEQNAGSSAVNRIELGSSADLLIYPGSTVHLWYDTATSRWQRMGGSALQTSGVYPGAIFSGNCPLSHTFALGYSVTGTVVCGQPSFSDLTATPTNLSGYGITDALKTTNNLSDVSNYATATNNLGHWYKTLSATVSKTANITSAGITDLSITGVAGKTYAYHVVLYTTMDATNGIRIRMGGTSTATSAGFNTSILCNSTKVFDQVTYLTAWGTTNVTDATCTAAIVEIRGTVVINAGGTILPQWAQSVTTNGSGVTSILMDGSYAEYHQMGIWFVPLLGFGRRRKKSTPSNDNQERIAA